MGFSWQSLAALCNASHSVLTAGASTEPDTSVLRGKLADDLRRKVASVWLFGFLTMGAPSVPGRPAPCRTASFRR